MNFTREPIIETIITPKEGYKLALRSSKGSTHEEFLLDFIEVVTFGSSTFFRSQERPKAFLIPVIDYEIIEVRETKMVLKSASLDKGIKIVSSKETPKAKASETTEKRKERRRTRRRKTKDDEPKVEAAEEQPVPFPDVAEKREDRPIIPPPSTLISETISRYKDTPTYSGAFFEQEEKEEKVEIETEKVPQETPDSEES